MSILTPVCRWQPAFYPFKREKPGKRFLSKVELWVKGPLFGCRMCGNCLLQETAFICPMECPKGIRNGPCGGSTSTKCYIDETRKCVWYEIYKKAIKTGREKTLLEVLPPLDWDKAGTETWGDVVRQIRKIGTGKFFDGLISGNREKRFLAWDSVFRPVRQPEWWHGDAEYHPAGYSEPVSELERRLRKGDFVVTTEIAPPLDANSDKLKQIIELVKPYVTAVNFTDCSSAIPRMSSIACCKVANDFKVEPVLQIAARDKTRTGLQAEIVGANEIGVRNVLCITGDSPKSGPSPVSNLNIMDIDSVQMLWILRRMRDEGIYLDGRKMENPPRLFLGAAASPFASEPEFQAIREHKKVNAGAQFFQTNLVFDPDRLDMWLEQLDKRDILNKVFILVGITPLKSYKMAEYLNCNVPGVTVPDNIMKRMAKAGNSAREEGVIIALEIIEAIKKKKGINGIHLMPVGWESIIPRLIIEAGLDQKSDETSVNKLTP
jgi:methylenetetrahydrofolate reductase (NADPH)